MSNYGKKAVALTAATCAMAMGLAGCGSDNSNSAEDDPNAKITLSISWWGSNNRVKITDQVLDLYEQQHPNVTIERQNSDWSGYWDKLATQSAGGNTPDVMQMGTMQANQYAAQGMLYDLSQQSVLDLSDIDESLVKASQIDGKQLTAPVSSTSQAIIVNHDILDELGLTLPDTSTWTWDDLADFSKQIYEKSGGTIYGIGDPGNTNGLYYMARQNGNEPYTDGKMTLTSDSATKFFTTLLDWSSDHVSPTPEMISEDLAASTEQKNFCLKKQAMIMTHSTQVTAYAKALGTENVSLEYLPTTDGKAGDATIVRPSMLWSVYSQTKYPKAAAELVNFLINNEEAGKIMGTERGIPANKTILKEVTDASSGTDKLTLEYISSLSERPGTALELEPNGASNIDKTLNRYMQDVLFNKLTPQEAGQKFVDEMQNSIKTA